MKILIVLSYFYPYISGVSEYARSLAEALCSRHDVTVLTGQHEKALPTEEIFKDYRIIRAPISFRLDKGYISPALFSLYKQLQAGADVINLHLPMLECGLLARMTCKPVILTYQCDMAYKGSMLSKAAVWGVRRSCTSALAKADRVATLSLDYASSSPLLSPWLNKTEEIWPPNRFEARARSAIDRLPTEPPSAQQRIQIGFVGRFVAEKGINVLLKAVELLGKENVKLRLVGDFYGVAGGSTYDRVKPAINALGASVDVLGKLDDEALEAFYSEIDILALPSVNRFEAFGMVQIEAMSFGAIPVSSDLPGVRSTIRATGIGSIARVSDAAALAEALRCAIKQRRCLSRRQVADSILGLRKGSFAGDYEKLFQSAMAERS